MIELTISICAFNDQESIRTLVEEAIEVCQNLHIDPKILIIDDGSSDNTLNIINALADQYENITIHKHANNLGFGATIAEVYQLPKTEWVLFLPGDHQIPADNLHKLITHVQAYDFILGHRIIRQDSPFRRMNSSFYNYCISKIAGQKIKDVNSTALVRSGIVQPLQLTSTSGFIHAEILLESLKNKCRFIELPIEHKDRGFGEASGGKFKTIFFTIFEMIKYIFRR